MKRIALILICISLLTGCSDSTPVAQHSENGGLSGEDLKQAKAYGKRLVELRDKARELEAKMDFAAAAEVWQQIIRQVGSDFGENSWQAINARIARKLALKKEGLMAQHSADVQKIESIEGKIRTAYQQQQTQLALELSQQLLQLQQPLLGDISMETARLKMQIGILENKLGTDQQAATNLHAGIEIFRGKGIELHPELEASLAVLADIYSRQQKFGPAVANQKAATQIAGHIWGTDSLQYATQANQLGVIFHRAGNDTVAFDVLNSALQVRKQQLGDESIEFAHSCLNLGIVTLAQQNLPQAQHHLTLARKLFIQKLGMENEFSIRSSDQLATVMMLQNRPDMTEQLLNEVLQAVEATAPRGQVADYRYKLAIAQARQGKYTTAEPLLQHVLSEQKSLHGATSSQAINAMKALARLFEATHQNAKLDSLRGQLNQATRVANGTDFKQRF